MSKLQQKSLNKILQNDNVDIEYVQIPYSSVEDSLISYTNSDLKKYIKNNKDQFKVESSRDIEYHGQRLCRQINPS